MILYQHAKNQVFSSFSYRDKVDLKILQSDWPRALWPRSQEPNFSQIRDFCKNTVYNANFHYKPNSDIIDQVQKKLINFSINSKDPMFGPFSPFWGQKFYFQIIRLCRALQHNTTWDFFEFQKKIMSWFQENVWVEGQRDRN